LAHDPGRDATWGRIVGEGISPPVSSRTAGGMLVDSPPPLPAPAGSPAGASSFASMVVGAEAPDGWLSVVPEEVGTETGVIET